MQSGLANLRRELNDYIGEVNKLGLCQEYLGIDLDDAKSMSICGVRIGIWWWNVVEGWTAK